MVTNVNDQNALTDNQSNRALIAHSGTAGTATIIRLVANSKGELTVQADATETTAFNGGTVAVGTAAVELTFTGVTQGIMITADHDNSREVFIGGSTVDKLGANAFTRLEAGESVSLDFNDGTAVLYVCGGTTSLKAFKVALI